MSIESTIQRVAVLSSALADPALLAQGSISTATTGGVAAPAATSGEEAGASSFAALLQQASLSLPGQATTSGEQTAGLPDSDQTSDKEPYGLSSADVYGIASAGSEPYASPATSNPLPGASYATAGTSGLYGVPSTTAAGGEIGRRIVAIAESQAGQAEQPPGSNESPAIATYRSATAGSIPGAPWCAYFASWVARQAGEPIGGEGQGLGAVSEIWSWAQSTGRAIENGPGVVPKPGDLIVFGDEHVGIVRGVLPNGQIETVEGNYENKVALNVRSPSEPTGYVEMS